MQDYTIGESYTLPSLGKIYGTEVNPEIKIRSMTTEEEMKRLAATDAPYKNMSEIIDDCLVEKPGISSYDMCIGDYQFLLHKLRVVTYGPNYKVSNMCPYCGSEIVDEINLDELPLLEYSEEYDKLREFDLPKSKSHVVLRVQTPRMLDMIANMTREDRKKSKGKGVDKTLIYTVANLVESIDGKKPSAITIEDWVKSLPMADTNAILNRAGKMNESIGVDINLTCNCDVCGLDFATVLKANSEFFRPESDF